MNAKSGNHRGGGRASRAGGANNNSHHHNSNSNTTPANVDRTNAGPSSSPTAGQNTKKDEGQSAVAASSPSSATTGDSSEFTIVQAILQNRANARLDTVQRLLKNVLGLAATVVRGTDSQRRFTTTYTEFCLSALRCMADVEDAVFEHTHPGRRATDATDDDVDGIAEDFFLKQVAAYVATHTKSLGLAYLEHVALGALEKQQQQRKRERAGTAERGGRAAKTSRAGGASSVHSNNNGSSSAPHHRGATGSTSSVVFGAGGDVMGSGSGDGGMTLAGAASASAAFDSLGLIDAQDTMREALQLIEQEKNATAGGGSAGSSGGNSAGGSGGGAIPRRRGAQAVTAGLGRTSANNRATGLFVSKAASSSGAEQVVYDLRNPQLRLSSIPELSARLQPWTMPLTASGVFLERVTVERERRGGPATASTNTLSGSTAGGGQTGTSNGSHAKSAVQPTLDVCMAPTPMELLRRYEAHEAVLAAEPQPWLPSSPSLSAGPFSVVPYAGKRGGGAASGVSPRPTPALAGVTHTTEGGASAHEAEALTSAVAVGGSGGGEGVAGSFSFFPAVRENKTLTCLPPFVISNVSHCGVSRMEFVYTMTPATKQA